jgi:phosphoribosylamine-glycine ligase
VKKNKIQGLYFLRPLVVLTNLSSLNNQTCDPETEVIIPRLQTDLVELLLAAWHALFCINDQYRRRSAVTIKLASAVIQHLKKEKPSKDSIMWMAAGSIMQAPVSMTNLSSLQVAVCWR